jgi:hypothetical protein
MLLISLTVFLLRPNTPLVLGAVVLAGMSSAFTVPVFMVLVGEAFGETGTGFQRSVFFCFFS